MNDKGASKLNPIGTQPRFRVLGLIGKDPPRLASGEITANYANCQSQSLALRVHEMTSTAQSIASDSIVTLDRRAGDRRERDSNPAPQLATAKMARRRHIDPTTCERDYRQDELDFMRAMDDYKRSAGRMFPTCSEVLEVVRSLGYVRLTDQQIEMLGETLVEPGDSFEATDDEADFDFED